MRSRNILLLACVFVLVHSILLLQFPPSVSAQTDANKHNEDDAVAVAKTHFTRNVFPVLKEKCFGCHGDQADDINGDLDLRSRKSMLVGGQSGGAAIVVGDPKNSLLYQSICWDGLEMPPKENDRLTEEQIEDVRLWIQQGAVWPTEAEMSAIRSLDAKDVENSEGILVPTSGGTSDVWSNRRYQLEDLWAFQALPKADALYPRNQNADQKLLNQETKDQESADQNPIDFFIQRKLASAGFEIADTAQPEVLLRRLSFDLTGLPPTDQQLEEFTEAWQRNPDSAWKKAVERLLDSPRYGERWAQHWLDVVRYADTGGMANDFERSNLWRYRDYVIRSFNENKPYDQFVIEQLAGDELADQSVLSRHQGDVSKVVETQLSGDYNEEEAEWIVATGFLRLGPWDNAMITPAEARQIYLDDLVNITGQTFLSTTMRCLKCHDHKFDPLPTRDYYRMYAAFATTQMAERKVPFVSHENLERMEQGRRHVQELLDFATAEKNKLVEKREAAAKAWYAERGLPYKNKDQRFKLPDDQKPPRNIGMTHVDEGRLKVREQDEWIWNRRLERYQPMAQSVYNAQSVKMVWNGARKLRIQKDANRDEPPATHILIGGALTALGDLVQPGVLSATAVSASRGKGTDVAERDADPFLITESVSGRRLELARWIVDPQNPLTSRSIVNRIWQYHFGFGLAANPNNFGVKGAKPSHPELLNFLAADFVENGWDIKRLHRMILHSKTYQQASLTRQQEKLAVSDPDNRLLAYFPTRRLTAEEIRDAMLLVTGELNSTLGGLPVMPEINMEVALQPRMIQFSLAPAYQPSPTPEQRNRRTIYAYRVRGQADPFLELFNQPNPNESCEMRDTAAVTPQVFSLLNSEMVSDRSIAMACRLKDEANSLADQIHLAFRLILGRSASPEEVQRLATYAKQMTQYHRQHLPPQVDYPTEINRSLVEEFSGQSFDYREILPVFEDYQADTKPADVDAEVRALADICLILFNTNEFMFLN